MYYKYIIIFFWVNCFNIIYSQNNKSWIIHPIQDTFSTVGSPLYFNSHLYIPFSYFPLNSNRPNKDDWGIIKFDLNGNIIKRANYRLDSILNGPSNSILHNNFIYVLSDAYNIYDLNQNYLCINKISSDLDIIDTYLYKFPDSSNIIRIHVYSESDTTLIVPVLSFDKNGEADSVRIYRINNNGKLLKYNSFSRNTNESRRTNPNIFLQKFDKKGLWVIGQYEFWEIDNDLNRIYLTSKKLGILGEIFGYSETFVDSTYLISYSYYDQILTYKTPCLSISNINTELLDSVLIETGNEKPSEGGIGQNFDFNEGRNSIFVVGMLDRAPGLGSRSNPLFIAKYDLNLNLIWKKYFDIKQYTISTGVLALETGGCIVTAIYRPPRNFYSDTNYSLVIKIDDEGNFPTSVSKDLEIKSGITIYPNPTSDKLFIKYNSKPIKSKIELLDINGKLLLCKKPLSAEYEINLNSLNAGLYYLRIWEGDLLIFIDTFIKK